MWMYKLIMWVSFIGGFIFWFGDEMGYIFHPTPWDYIRVIGKAFGLSLFTALLGLCVSLLIFIFGSVVVTVTAEREEVKSYEKPIYSLQDNMGVSGRFYIGRGTIDSGLKYYFLVEEERGEKVESSSADRTYLKRDGGKYVEYYDVQFKNKFLRDHFMNMSDYCYYVLHIPQDTIEIDNYRIDLQ